MSRSSILGSLVLVLSAGLGLANPATLTLLEGAGLNEVQISLAVPFFPTQTRPSTLSGTVEVQLGVDTDADTASILTVNGASINATDVNFDPSGFFGSINVTATGMVGTVFTTSPPGISDPATSTFDASQHEFLINQGNLTGTAVGSPVAVNLTETPFRGLGQGSGSFVLTRQSAGPDGVRYQLSLTTPVNITQQVPTGIVILGSEVEATVTVTGTVTAVAEPGDELVAAYSNYLAWAAAQGIPGAASDADSNNDGILNGINWALGLTHADDVRSHLARPDPGAPKSFLLPLPAGGTAAPITVEISPSLAPGSWVPAAPADLSIGLNPLPPGTAGEVTLTPATAAACFTRMSVTP